jgi:competence protein ComEC
MHRWGVILLVFAGLYLLRLFTIGQVDLPEGAQISLVARVTQQPYLKASKQIISLGQFLVVTERYPEYFYGQKLRVVGKLSKKVTNSLQTNFTLYYPAIQVVEEEESLINQRQIRVILFRARQSVERLFSRLLPEPQASLLAGVVLGVKREMPENFLNNLRKTGTIHIIVASGYNLTVVAGLLIAVLAGRLRRQLALVVAFLGILAYTLMVGAEPPVVRAFLMASLTFLAQFLGREKEARLALAFSAMLMLLISPLILFDIGFQLSFLATAGILFLSSRWRGKFWQLPLVGENFRTSLAAQLGVMPVLLLNFGSISFLSPLINALVLPVIPLAMILGGLTVVLGWLPFLAQILARLAWVPLTYLVKVVDWFASLPLASFTLERLPYYWVVGYYLVIILWCLRTEKRS